MTDTNQDAWLRLAIMEASLCIHDLAMQLQKPPEARDEGKIGGAALGFDRAAAAVRGKPLEAEQDPQHRDNKGTMG